MMKVAINGFGRIGRAVFKIVVDTPELELVGLNDIAPVEDLAYLLRYDTVYGRYDHSTEVGDGKLVVGGEAYPVFSEKDPAQLPWGELGVDVVFECTGVFLKQEDLEKHIQAGAGHVMLSAPARGSHRLIGHRARSPCFHRRPGDDAGGRRGPGKSDELVRQ